MGIDATAIIRAIEGSAAPSIDGSAFVAAHAVVVGDVTIEADASVWYHAVLRAEQAAIRIGARSNLQDGVVCHVDAGSPLTLGTDVSVGHTAVLHGCTIEDGSLVGMHATVLNGAVIGAGSLVAAGAVVLEGTIVPPGSLVAGVPAKVRRELTDAERDGIRENAATYLRLRAIHDAAR